MEERTTYSYRPVASGSKGFRLAILQPATDFPAPITCDLIEVTLDSHPKYEALSYVWGDPSIQATLQIEGSNLKVTANLDLALRYLRLRDAPRTIWVDAICIDQSNISERNEQVRFMKGIYSSCEVDLVWIGEADEYTQLAIDTVKQMKSLNLQRLTHRGRKDFAIAGSDELVSFYDLGLDRRSSWPLRKLLRQPTLWERVWVMQEIACCPRALLIVGELSLPWEIISGILDHSGTPDRYHLPFSHQMYAKDIWDAFARVQVIEHQREARNLEFPLNSTLLDVMSRFRETYSTDPRDKIYGLLGLATDNLDIIPDYNKTPQEVYVDVARAQINSTGNLDIITQSLWPLGHTPANAPRAEWMYSSRPSTLVENLPSWLPNFSCTVSKKILFAQRGIFSAGAEKCNLPVEISCDGELTITGVVLGAITTLKSVRAMVYSGGQYFSPWARDWMPDYLSNPNSDDESYVTGGKAFEAYWRTLMTDCLAPPARRLSQENIQEYAAIFDEWRQKTSSLPFSDPKTGRFDKYDGDEKLLYKMGGMGANTGAYAIMREWQFSELVGGLYAMVPWGGLSEDGKQSQIGDLVVAVDGGKVPLVLRERIRVDQAGSGSGRLRCEVVGTAYVHGFMDGLAAEWAEAGKVKRQTFNLI